MAITRAQQFKQMLAQGGRIGLKPGGPPGGGATSMGSGRDFSGPSVSSGSGGNNYTDRIMDVAQRQRRADLRNLSTRQADDKLEEKLENFRKLGSTQRKFQNFLSKISPTSIIGSKFGPLNTRDFLTYNVLDAGRYTYKGPNTQLAKKLGSGPVTLDQFANLTEEEKEDVLDSYQSQRGLGQIDAYGNPIGDGGGGRDGINQIIPVDTTFAQAPSITKEEEKNNFNFRLLAEGGRAGFQEGGGIEQRLEQLGGDVTSAEQMLQGINQRLKTAESSLGSSGGGMQSPFTDQGSIVPQGGGIGGLPTTFAGGPKIPSISSVQTPDPFFGNTSLATFAINNPLPGIPDQQPMGLAAADGTMSLMSNPLSPQQRMEQANAEAEKLSPEERVRNAQGSLANRRMKSPQEREYLSRVIKSKGMDYLYGIDFFKSDNQLNVDLPQTLLAAQQPMIGIPAAGYADGGNVVGGEYDFESARQMYGLGKLVKKVTRTVKKIAKSPVGKAAILAATYKLGGGKFFGGEGFKFSNLPGLGFLKPASTSVGAQAAAVGLSPREFMMGMGGKTATSGGIFSSIPGGALTAGIVGTSAVAGLLTPEEETEAEDLARGEGIDIDAARNAILAARQDDFRARRFRAEGGSMKEPVAKKTMPLLDLDGKEMDLRAEGGFVPIGRMEKADDVPARLSKNEFVFTADAVRNAGDGNVDKGAEVMYNMMKNLEAGGEVSKESQGLEGARRMFQTSKRLEEVL